MKTMFVASGSRYFPTGREGRKGREGREGREGVGKVSHHLLKYFLNGLSGSIKRVSRILCKPIPDSSLALNVAHWLHFLYSLSKQT